MEFAFLNPQHLHQLSDEVLLHILWQYRQAVRSLEDSFLPSAADLRARLLHAIHLLEREGARRALVPRP